MSAVLLWTAEQDQLEADAIRIILVTGEDAWDGGRHMLRRLLGADKMGHTKAWEAGCSGTSGVRWFWNVRVGHRIESS